MRIAVVALVAAIAAGCAATYVPPTGTAQPLSVSVKANREQIIRTAQRVLALEGVQVLSADTNVGIMSAGPWLPRLTPAHANCGTTMGIDYLKDNRTETTAMLTVIADDDKLTIKTSMSASYKPGAVDQDIKLTCVSRGVLERELADKIAAALPS